MRKYTSRSSSLLVNVAPVFRNRNSNLLATSSDSFHTAMPDVKQRSNVELINILVRIAAMEEDTSSTHPKVGLERKAGKL
jgi:hypothetical protein